MWRPEGWKNYCGKGFKFGGWSCPDEITRRVCAGIYEAGGDMMLEELKKDSNYVHKKSLYSNEGGESKEIFRQEAGWVVFIPEE